MRSHTQSRGVYETPAGEILRTAHIDIEGLTIDREVRKIRDMLSVKLTEQVRQGGPHAPAWRRRAHTYAHTPPFSSHNPQCPSLS